VAIRGLFFLHNRTNGGEGRRARAGGPLRGGGGGYGHLILAALPGRGPRGREQKVGASLIHVRLMKR
jgi:hypothetical protein